MESIIADKLVSEKRLFGIMISTSKKHLLISFWSKPIPIIMNYNRNQPLIKLVSSIDFAAIFVDDWIKNWKEILTCVSVNIKFVATSNLFGLDKYLFCLNCFSNSNNCWDVKAVLGLLVFPNKACPGPQPKKRRKLIIKTKQMQNMIICTSI